ncbi:MAG TPA: hypothetical protein DG753_11500 [Clostridium sp.]|nr:hypothetical protein [Clostridium sp.]
MKRKTLLFLLTGAVIVVNTTGTYAKWDKLSAKTNSISITFEEPVDTTDLSLQTSQLNETKLLDDNSSVNSDSALKIITETTTSSSVEIEDRTEATDNSNSILKIISEITTTSSVDINLPKDVNTEQKTNITSKELEDRTDLTDDSNSVLNKSIYNTTDSHTNTLQIISEITTTSSVYINSAKDVDAEQKSNISLYELEDKIGSTDDPNSVLTQPINNTTDSENVPTENTPIYTDKVKEKNETDTESTEISTVVSDIYDKKLDVSNSDNNTTNTLQMSSGVTNASGMDTNLVKDVDFSNEQESNIPSDELEGKTEPTDDLNGVVTQPIGNTSDSGTVSNDMVKEKNETDTENTEISTVVGDIDDKKLNIKLTESETTNPAKEDETPSPSESKETTTVTECEEATTTTEDEVTETPTSES